MTAGSLKLVLVVALALSLLAPVTRARASAARADEEQETPDQRDVRMKWWREARFGMFIHWGLYAVPAGTYDGKRIPGIGEWIMNHAKIPVATYAKYAEQFNPTKFNAEEWVLLAKNAGMKYIVITSKHHDGFAMFASKASPYNIVDATPFKRDPLKELAEACAKHDMRLGFYYSQAQDWHHPGGRAIGGHWDPAQDGDMDKYIREIAVPQVRELLTNYGKVSVLWWDTPDGMTRERADMLRPLLKLQPGIITNNRLGVYPGDSETPEQFIPATGFPGRDWETCMTLNDTWGYKSYDDNWKSTEILIRNLVDIASKGGNYLLNVGPTAEGIIPQPSVERLQQVGQWMKTNGEAIYATGPSPFKKLPFGRCTRKGNTLYLFVFDWPKDGLLTVPVTNKPLKAFLLADPDKALACDPGEQGLKLTLPAQAPDKIATVVSLEFDGEPQLLAAAPVAPAADGTITLLPGDAELVGPSLAVEEKDGKPNLGYWTDVHARPEWKVRLPAAGKYTVEIDYACAPDSDGSKFRIECGGATLEHTVAPTGSWQDFKIVAIGTIEAPAGLQTLTIRPLEKPRLAVMNLRRVVLKPAK